MPGQVCHKQIHGLDGVRSQLVHHSDSRLLVCRTAAEFSPPRLLDRCRTLHHLGRSVSSCWCGMTFCSPERRSLTATFGHSSPNTIAKRALSCSAAWNCFGTFAAVNG